MGHWAWGIGHWVWRINLLHKSTGLTQKITKVAVIHELPLRLNKVFSHILRKSRSKIKNPTPHLSKANAPLPKAS